MEVVPGLGIVMEVLRWWVEQAKVDAGDKPGVSTNAAEEVCRLKREEQELRSAGEIVKTALVFFVAEFDRLSMG